MRTIAILLWIAFVISCSPLPCPIQVGHRLNIADKQIISVQLVSEAGMDYRVFKVIYQSGYGWFNTTVAFVTVNNEGTIEKIQ